jgi:hypothetical protein
MEEPEGAGREISLFFLGDKGNLHAVVRLLASL